MKPMHLDPVSLKLFISVIEESTIAGASEREHIAAAAVSKRISELEATLNTTLIVRTNKGIQPTTAGVALSAMARRALRELEDVAVQMQDYSSGMRGVIRVFANISVLTQFLPQDIKSFLGEYPEVQLHLEEKTTPVILKSVYENSADVGICSGNIVDSGVQSFPYRQDTLALIVPSDHPLTKMPDARFADALDYDFIGLHTGSAINRIVSSAADNLKRNVRVKVQVTGFDTLCFMVNAGLGIGVLPVDIAKRYSQMFDVRILDIDEPWACRQLQICVRSLDGLSMAARSFVNHLRDSSPG
ncbi:LysR family transcriptional regulator [Pararobbsia alpina]|uniref:HTH-type transcriptional regulator GltC n=1 Tax=Pararobbsia alpina TaxID=621374 RepID=A0A6S7B7C0_9BURK|nr:LysR family transcriptional regulator [Pararobbsia alpina]CAB3779905.1 HTH-type transcriptional regulator GltC [Pararobbsia alpina]